MKLPENVYSQIDNVLDAHNRKCRQENRLEDVHRFSIFSSSIRSSVCTYMFIGDERFLVLYTKHGKENWRRMTYRILSDDARFTAFVDKIASKYCDDMYEYYTNYENKD